jgi:thioredoxin-related protein
MRVFIYILASFIFLACTLGCATTPPEKRNSELIVTYNGKEVHRAGSMYKSFEEFEKILQKKEKQYIIFSARWCSSCKFLQKALIQGNFIDKVTLLDIDEPWVAHLAKNLKIKNVPTMIVADKDGQIIDGRIGSPPIVLYLVINTK